MYKVIIELKQNISDDVLKKLTKIINAAFDNRLGKVSNSHTDSFCCFEFLGDEEKFDCMQWGLVILKKEKVFWESVNVWKWIDYEDPDESCDVKKVFSKFLR